MISLMPRARKSFGRFLYVTFQQIHKFRKRAKVQGVSLHFPRKSLRSRVVDRRVNLEFVIYATGDTSRSGMGCEDLVKCKEQGMWGEKIEMTSSL